jgi:hypothetical protein
VFKWRKLGLAFEPRTVTGRPWLDEFAQAPASLLFPDFVRIYFSCRPSADDNGQYVSYSAYVDLDKRDLFKVVGVADQPILPLGQIGAFDEFGIYPVSVIRYQDTVRAYYAGWTRCESVPFNVAIGCAESFDGGQVFHRIGPGPVISYSAQEPFVMSGPKIRRFGDTWYLFYIAGKMWKVVAGRPEPVYRIRMATSPNGLSWTKFDRDLIDCRVEEHEAQASPDVFFYNNRYHMFFCYRHSEDYRGRKNGYRIGYAWSDDLFNWQRNDSLCGIDVSDQGWDSEMISYPHIFAVDEAIYMAYLGNQVGRAGFGLAVLDGPLC